MLTQTIYLAEENAVCVFPNQPADLARTISKLGLKDSYPVIVLIGGDIQEEQADVTHKAIETLARAAEETNALVICGGTNMGVMAEIGQIRKRYVYKFPLVGIAPEALVTWPDGPQSTKFLWWGKKRWELARYYSHFILVPGEEFGDESPWIVDAATMLSKNHRSVTVLINGGNISRKDIELSIANDRPVIALSGTGRLADILAGESNRHNLISVVPAAAENRVYEAVQTALAGIEQSALHPALVSTH